MKTQSIMVQTLCVPCYNHCRYCLLSWDGSCIGAEYERSRRYAESFHSWIHANRPDLNFAFSFGYSMDHPMLFEAIDFLRSIGSPSGEYLQFDGLRMRDADELRLLMEGLVIHGIKQLNFTFYGETDYHDRFAGRKGDFKLLLNSAEEALRAGLRINAGIPVTQENASQADRLLSLLRQTGFDSIRYFIPHEEGRGITLRDIRCTEADLEPWSEEAKRLLNRKLYRTEAEWIASTEYAPKNRALLLSLTKENMDLFERMEFSAAISWLEELDETYYARLPSFSELASQYGDPKSIALYQQRDLLHHYQKQYLSDHQIIVYDITDERQSGSRRY